MKGLTLERVRRDVEVLSRAGLDTPTFLSEVYASLDRAVPSCAGCVATLDPATRLVTGTFKFGDLSGRHDQDHLWGLFEYGQVEATSFSELTRAGIPAAGVHRATGGDVQRSARLRDLMRPHFGYTDELRLMASSGGQVWGGICLFRDDTSPPYEDHDIDFVASLSGFVGSGLRVGLLARRDDIPVTESTSGPSVIVVDSDGHLTHTSAGAHARLQELAGGMHTAAPTALVGALVAGARRYGAGLSDMLPSTRVRLTSGQWVVLHASPLSAADGSTGSVVITIEEARPPEIVPLVVVAFDLTPRERDVTQLVLQGLDTREIAATLHMSAHTVQDHLKSIFSKTDVSSRRELVARVFFDQYVPRLGGALSPSGGFARE